MSLDLTDRRNKGKVSPPPIHEQVLQNGKATQAFVRYLLDLRASGFNIYDEVDKVIEVVNNIIEGAGLNEDGTYTPEELAHYINEALSLNDADQKLDTAIWEYTRELVITLDTATTLEAVAQTVLVDATEGAVSITMPPPADCFDIGRSLRFAVHKIDTSANIITVLPNDGELVVGEASQTLELDGEIYNFITDGTNWYLGA